MRCHVCHMLREERMLFSGQVTIYQYSACGREFCNVSPTSLIPTAITCIVAGRLWTCALLRTMIDHWSMHLVGFLIALMTFLGIYIFTEGWTTSNLRSKQCPQCNGELKRIGGGFYDGMTPAKGEPMSYLVTLGIGLAVFSLSWTFGHDGKAVP